MLLSRQIVHPGALLAALLPAADAVAAPVDLSPPRNALGAADENGQVRYVHRFGDLAFSDNFTIPLRFDFSSRRVVEGTRSDFGWHGWQCGAIESRAQFLEDGRLLRIDLLCAKVLVLARVDGDAGRYLSSDGSWSGLVDGEEIRVERGDGWSLRFRGGRVDSFRTDRGRLIRWIREESGRVVEVAEEGAAAPALSVSWDGGRASALDLGGIRYELDYEGDALSAFRWRTSAGLDRALLAKQAPNGLSLETSRFVRHRFQWNPDTGVVVADGGNRYVVRREETGRTFLTLTEPSGGVSSYELGKAAGELRRSHPSGGEIVVSRVDSAGKDNGAVAKVEWVREGKQPLLLMSNVFDDRGRIVRRVWRGNPRLHTGYGGGRIEPALLPDREGTHPADDVAGEDLPLSMIEYTFTEDDKLLSTKVDREPVLTLSYDGEKRLVALRFRERFERRIAYGEDGSVTETLSFPGMGSTPFWYLERDNEGVGSDLVVSFTEDADGRLLERRYADGRRLAIVYDALGRRVGEEVVARDGRTRVGTVTYVHPPDGGLVLRIRENHLVGSVEREEIEGVAVGLDVPGRRIPREVAAAE